MNRWFFKYPRFTATDKGANGRRGILRTGMAEVGKSGDRRCGSAGGCVRGPELHRTSRSARAEWAEQHAEAEAQAASELFESIGVAFPFSPRVFLFACRDALTYFVRYPRCLSFVLQTKRDKARWSSTTMLFQTSTSTRSGPGAPPAPRGGRSRW